MKLLRNRVALAVSLIALIFICGAGQRAFTFARDVYRIATTSKEQINFSGNVKATAPGKTIIGLSVKTQVPESQMILFLGRMIVRGKFTAATSSALPTKLRLLIRHKNAGNRVVQTTSFDVNMQSNGTILSQNFAYTVFDVIPKNETLDLSITPVDKNLPAGNLKITMIHAIGLTAIKEEAEPELTTASLPPQLIFTGSNYIEDRAKGKVFGPYIIRNTTQAGFSLNGIARVKGKFTPDEPGQPVPNTIQVIVKHKNQTGGALLRTETFNVKVQSDGRILTQSFPITTLNDQGVPEFLEVSMKPQDKAFPYSFATVTLSYTPAG